MADGGLSTIDENHTNISQTVVESSKGQKISFLSHLKQRFSFHKRDKKKDIEKDTQDLNDNKNKKYSNNENNNLNNKKSKTEISENKFSAIRRSFGKGKNKENVINKDMENTEISRNKESLSHNQSRPLSMHIANLHPPRYSLLASFGWYWGPLSRSEATHRLRHQDDGSFLVRDSEGDPNKFTLSFKGAGQIFHNRILQHQNKYAFLPDEEFNSIPDLISDAMRRSATSAYCFSRSTDTTPTNLATLTDTNNCQDNVIGSNGQCVADTSSTLSKHEVRLLKPISRFTDSPRSLFYLCRFMIRQYTRYQDLCKLAVNQEIMSYLEDPKYNL